MKKVNGKDVLTIQTANETEIALSRTSIKNAQQVLNMMVDVLFFIEKEFFYDEEDRRGHALIIARQQFEEGMEAVSSLIGYETMTIALDSVKNE